METPINERIRAIADRKELTANALAKMLGVSVSATYVALRGDAKPSYEMLQKIADTFPDVSMEWLMRGRGPIFQDDINSDPACWDLLKREEEQHSRLRSDYAAIKESLRAVRNTLIHTQKLNATSILSDPAMLAALGFFQNPSGAIEARDK